MSAQEIFVWLKAIQIDLIGRCSQVVLHIGL